MPTFFVNNHKLLPEHSGVSGSPLVCERCKQYFRDIETARCFDCVTEGTEHLETPVVCEDCGYKPVGNGLYAPRTMTFNKSQKCNAHEAFPFGADTRVDK